VLPEKRRIHLITINSHNNLLFLFQEYVDSAPVFPEVLKRFENWRSISNLTGIILQPLQLNVAKLKILRSMRTVLLI